MVRPQCGYKNKPKAMNCAGWHQKKKPDHFHWKALTLFMFQVGVIYKVCTCPRNLVAVNCDSNQKKAVRARQIFSPQYGPILFRLLCCHRNIPNQLCRQVLVIVKSNINCSSQSLVRDIFRREQQVLGFNRMTRKRCVGQRVIFSY